MRADIKVMLELTADEAKMLRDACGRAAFDSTNAEAQKRLEDLFYLFDQQLNKKD